MLRIDTSNMADVFYAPDAVNQGALEGSSVPTSVIGERVVGRSLATAAVA